MAIPSTELISSKFAAKRKRLTDAALRVFLRKGFHATRIEDIITEAKTGKGTFYLYYKDKDEVFEAFVDEFFGKLKGTLLWAFDHVSARTSLPQIFDEEASRLFRTFQESENVARLILRDGKSAGPRIGRKISALYGEIIEISRRTFEFAMSLDLLPKTDPKITAVCVIGAIEKVYELWLSGELTESEESIRKETSAFLQRGCGLVT